MIATLIRGLAEYERLAHEVVRREEDLEKHLFTSLHLEDLFVVPAARHRGYGKALLQYLAQLAVERGCGRFEWNVLDWNTPAIEFYRACGAQVMSDWRVCRLTGEALARFAGRI